MIKFTKEQENEQYISIKAPKGTTENILQRLIDRHSSISKDLFKLDKTEVLLRLPENDEKYFDFSYSTLIEDLKQIFKDLKLSKPIKSCFVVVDFEMIGQRITYLNKVCQ